jgi:hypothetical protein
MALLTIVNNFFIVVDLLFTRKRRATLYMIDLTKKDSERNQNNGAADAQTPQCDINCSEFAIHRTVGAPPNVFIFSTVGIA